MPTVTRLTALAVAGLLLAFGALAPAHAAEIADVSFEETVTEGGAPLVLNGVALRKKWMITVYAIGLYVTAKSSDAAAILAADTARSARMVLKLDLAGSKLGGSIGEAFEKNPANDMAALGDRLTRFKGMFAEGRKGEVLTLSYAPGAGTSITQAGKALGTIEGKDFADALFGVWIGAGSVDADLSNALLGK